MAEMTMRRWRILRATETNIIEAEVAVLEQMLREEISEKRELVHEREELMVDERRSFSSHCMSIYNQGVG
jgi:hypothetical protein